MPAPPTPHLVIPFAACNGQAWLEAMQTMPAARLQNLTRLLQGMKVVRTDNGEASSLSPPHERALAHILGLTNEEPLPDGLIPWAAVQAEQLELATEPGQAWATITPCHWAMGREHATLTDPAALKLMPDESRTLMEAMQPYFETESIVLNYAAPDCWLAQGEVFRRLPTASLDRVLGRNVDPWLPGAKTAPSLRRLQNEMQMLLYTHPLNDLRTERRMPSVNSFWISGSGALHHPRRPPAAVPQVPRSLAQAAFSDDWGAYAQAWAALDAGEIAELLSDQRSGKAVRLTLCGERQAQSYESVPRTLFSRLSSLLSPQPASTLLQQL